MPTRRALLRAGGLATLGAIAAACSSSTPSRRTSSLRSGTATLGTSPSSASSGTQAPARVVELGTHHVAAKDAISIADAQRFAPFIGGHWRGAWRDDTGASGTSDLLIAIDVRHQKVRATIDAGGAILGAGSTIAPVTYEIDLLGFARNAAAWMVASPQLGKVVATADGGVSLTASATDVPGHPEIAKIDISGTRLGKRVDGRYTLTGKDGKKRTGTMAWTSAGPRAVPTDPTNNASNSVADVLSGRYAASFGSASELSAAMGRETRAPVSNGGKIGYAPGIDVSNANAFTADGQLVIQYSVYRGATAALTASFWHNQLLNQPGVSGPWQAAFFQSPGFPTLYAYQGSRVLIVNIAQTVGATKAPTPDAVQHLVLAVAKLLMPELNSR